MIFDKAEISEDIFCLQHTSILRTLLLHVRFPSQTETPMKDKDTLFAF